MIAIKLKPVTKELIASKKPVVFVVAILLYVIMIGITFALPPHCSKLGYFAGLKDKHHTLKSVGSPKIVFVGGSNLAFGLDSNFIEKQFRRPVVNMGLCSSFGLRYLLEEIKDNIGAGDTIVLIPEYALIDGLNVEGSPDLIRAVEVYPYSALFILRAYGTSLKNIFSFLQIAQGYFCAKWRTFYDILQIAWQKKQLEPLFQERPEVTAQIGSSARFCFDKHGDYFGHFERGNVGYIPTKWLIGGMTKEAANVINDFNKEVHQRGAIMVLIPPPVPTEYFILSELTPQTLSTWTNNLTVVPALADPMRYLIPVSYFFEAPYHLNVEGRAIRTRLICEDLNRYFCTLDRRKADFEKMQAATNSQKVY